MLTAKDILNGRPVPTKRVEVEEWGGEVFVRKLTVDGARALRAPGGNDVDKMVSCCIECVCDGDGKPLFSESDRNRLVKQEFAVLDMLAEEIAEFSGLAESQESRKKK